MGNGSSNHNWESDTAANGSRRSLPRREKSVGRSSNPQCPVSFRGSIRQRGLEKVKSPGCLKSGFLRVGNRKSRFRAVDGLTGSNRITVAAATITAPLLPACPPYTNRFLLTWPGSSFRRITGLDEPAPSPFATAFRDVAVASFFFCTQGVAEATAMFTWDFGPVRLRKLGRDWGQCRLVSGFCRSSDRA